MKLATQLNPSPNSSLNSTFAMTPQGFNPIRYVAYFEAFKGALVAVVCTSSGPGPNGWLR